jgi:hypothetical protein
MNDEALQLKNSEIFTTYPLISHLFLVQIFRSYFKDKSDDSTEEAWDMDDENKMETLQLK